MTDEEKNNQRISDHWQYVLWMIHWGGTLFCKAALASIFIFMVGYAMIRSILT